MKVLIADDDSKVCMGLKSLIPWDEMNCKIVGEANNGEDALKVALREHPDMIITDIKMPIMDGLELCEKIGEAMPETVIIILSAYEDFDYARSAIRSGVRNYYIKPLSREKVNELIEDIRSLKSDFERKRNLYLELYNADMEESLFAALEKGDLDYFDHYFREMSSFFYDRSINPNELGAKYIDILFRFFKNIGVNAEPILDSKDRIMDELFTFKTRKEIEAYIQQLFTDVLSFTTDKKGNRSDILVEDAKRYIRDKYTDANFSIADVADKLYMTPSHLGVLFRQMTGTNMTTYLKEMRMEKASALLRDSMQTITEIAEKAGFQDPHYFSSVFKKSMNMTPSEYRYLHVKVRKESV